MIPQWLSDLLRTHPAYREEDVLKSLFQSIYGVGHLLSEPLSVQRYIVKETSEAGPNRNEPLTERVGDWLRLNLRPARDMGLQPAWIAAMMCASPAPATADRRSLIGTLAQCGSIPGMDMDRLFEQAEELAARPKALPSHSDSVHRFEDPRYRLIHSDWSPVITVLTALAKLPEAQPRLITIDGRCGAGKTTLAEKLKIVLNCPVLHTDDFVIPHAQKTAERLAIPGGNEDVERIAEEILKPFFAGKELRPRKYNWYTDAYEDLEPIPAGKLLILEGSYSNLPPIAEHAALRVFLSIDPDRQMERLRKRNSPEALQGFINRWIPLEEAYLEAYRLPDKRCLVLEA